MAYEDPRSLLARLRLGREEYCQRLLTALILGGPYPRWNTRNTPTAAGVAYLQALDEVCFGQAGEPARVFVDELDLPRRHEVEKGGAPDQAVLWSDRLWLIELKTEPGSHRRDQLPSYFELGAHHFPGTRVDITYLTPTMAVLAPAVVPPNRYAHVTWDTVAELIRLTWGRSEDEAERDVADALIEAVTTLETPVSTWRVQAGTPDEAAPSVSAAAPVDVLQAPAPPAADGAALVDALAAARLTGADGRPRAVNLEETSLSVLQDLRLHERQQLCSEPPGSPLRHVMPWLWSAQTSGGAPLTAPGGETGYELRMSRYKRPLC